MTTKKPSWFDNPETKKLLAGDLIARLGQVLYRYGRINGQRVYMRIWIP